VARNSIVHDALYYTSPGTFNPLRFHDATPSGADGNNARSYAKLSSDNLGFGYGREACPGRFYASAQIKLVLAMVLGEFEVRYPRGQEGRPGNLVVDERVDASVEQEVVIERI
jgi:cytochrome P450